MTPGFSPRPVVVAYDGSERARAAVELGAVLARTVRAPVTLVCVHAPDSRLFHQPNPRDAARDVLASAPLAALDGLAVDRRTVIASSAATGIAGLLEELDARMVVVGSTGRGALGQLVPGSTADRLLLRAPCAIAIAPRGYLAASVRVLAVGFDDSPESQAALALARECAESARGTIRVFAVARPGQPAMAAIPVPGAGAWVSDSLEERLRHAVDAFPVAVRADGRMLSGEPAGALIEEASKGVDLMFVGSRGWGPLRRALGGSVSAEVRRRAECPVVIVPPGARSRAPHLADNVGDRQPPGEPEHVESAPPAPSPRMFEIRIHGRGGQGVVTAAEVLSVAAFLEGWHAQAFPSFGSERTGAPVVAFCRIADREIRTRAPIVQPDALIIQDPTLLHQVDVFGGLRPDGYIVINSARSFDELGLREFSAGFQRERLVTVPATEIARQHLGRPLPNVPLLGAFAALSGLISIHSVETAIRDRFSGDVAEANVNAADSAFETVRMQRARLEEPVHA